MAALLATLIFLAQDDSPGPRGDNPSDIGGILIIVGIALVVLLAFGVGMYRRKSRVR